MRMVQLIDSLYIGGAECLQVTFAEVALKPWGSTNNHDYHTSTRTCYYRSIGSPHFSIMFVHLTHWRFLGVLWAIAFSAANTARKEAETKTTSSNNMLNPGYNNQANTFPEEIYNDY
jgi:hypothetical protein